MVPDGTVYKERYAGVSPAPWQKGLVLQSEVWSAGVQRKLSTASWTQDNPSVNYKTNPRVIETNVYDASGNRRRTTIDYSVAAYARYGLPYFVREFAADATTPLRTKYSDYNLAPEYLERRIIGLVDTIHVVDHVTGSYVSKVSLSYDWDNQSNTYLIDQGGATQHDNVNYAASLRAGRGNLCAVRRWNVNAITDWNQGQWVSFTGYNTNGSVIFTADALGHETRYSYADSFSDGNNGRNTFAYPSTVTDADGFSSSVQHNFDFGAKTRIEGPPPQNQSNGAIQTFSYDAAARLQRTTTANTGAYTHNVYGPNYVQSYSSVNNVASNYSESDLYSITVFDGVGRGFTTTTNHPGSSGGYKLVNVIFDRMGRPVLQSNPTEVNSSWLPAGDDAVVFYSQQSFDWQGRPLRTTHPDGYFKEASYAGCGCAGGEVVTLQGEETLVNGEWKRRTQKVYSDVLGREWKSEVLNWDGTVYSTTTNTFNARDQVTLVRRFAGTDQSQTYQDTTMSYDGYGRVQSKHAPEQDTGTATTWTYKPDDAVESVTDARGASATYIYNNGRHLVNEIHYSAPGGITPTSNVSFGYDAAGNRISMTDGLGSQSYNYNQLSQMISETRTFTGVGSYTLSYDYNLAGQLKRITDATNMTINYGFDSSGRLSSVTGSDNLFQGISNYASNFQYRAWDGLKTMSDGSNHVSSLAYNSKLQPTQFDISGGIVHQNYDYQNDGRLSFVHNTNDTKFDRSYSYDHAGRLTEAKTGGQARGDATASPYYETFGYDAFSNLTARQSNNWTQDTLFDSSSYSNHRRSGWGYDADGRNTTIGTRTYAFDADGQVASMAGQKWIFNHYINITQTLGYDGDGQKVKEGLAGAPTYYLRSTVLDNAIIEEITNSGQKKVGYVYSPQGGVLAKQVVGGSNSYVVWKHGTPAGTGQYDWVEGPAYGNGLLERVELDPMGADVGIEAPQTSDLGGGEGDIGSSHFTPVVDSRWSNFFDLAGGCTAAGVVASCKSAPYVQTQARDMLGDRWYDLPGNDNVVERTLGLYVRDVNRIFSEANAQQAEKKKPRPTLSRGRGRQRRVGTATRPRRTRGTPQGEEQKVFGGQATDPVPITRVEFLPKGGSYGNNGERMIRSMLDSLLENDECNRAFYIVTGKTIRDIVKSGLVIGPATLLNNPANNSLTGINEIARSAYSGQFARGGEAATIRNVTGQPFPFVSQSDQRTRMFFAAAAFNDGMSGLSWDMVHEFYHASGQGPVPGWLGGLRHDLAGDDWHDFLQEACKRK